MATAKHVAVIGGGAVGLCTAYYLQKDGHTVTVIEKGTFDSGASVGNAGMLVPSHVVPLAAPGVIAQGMRWLFRRDSPFRIKPRLDLALASWLLQFRKHCTEQHVKQSIPLLRDLSLASVDLFAELAAQHAFDFERKGLLMLHNSEKGAYDNLKYAKLAREAGLQVESLGKDALFQLEPNCQTAATGAVYYPQDAHLSPNKLVHTLSTHLEETNAVTLMPGTAVTGFSKSNHLIKTVQTTDGEVSADEVVLCAGSWSPVIGQMLDLKLPVQPAKGYSLTLEAPENMPTIPMILAEAKVTVTPMGQKLRFGGTLELAGYDNSVDRTRASSLLATMQQYYPDKAPEDVPTTNIWSGFRPCSPDGLPLLGRVQSTSNLIVATGHAMIGITLAPITGVLVAQLAGDKTTSINIDALNPARFYLKKTPTHQFQRHQDVIADSA